MNTKGMENFTIERNIWSHSRDVTTGKWQLRPLQWQAEPASLGWDRIKVSEKLGATGVAPVAPVATSLHRKGKVDGLLFYMPNTTDYGHPERKQPSLHGRKFNPNPKFLGMAAAYFVCHIGPFFQISLIYAFIGCLQSVPNTIAFNKYLIVFLKFFYRRMASKNFQYIHLHYDIMDFTNYLSMHF